MDLKHKLAGLLVAASFAGTGTIALANADDLQSDIDGSDAGAVARAHGTAISELARETESGPGKGAIVSAAASAHGKATSEAAKQRGDDDDTDGDEDSDNEEDSDTDEDTGTDEETDTDEDSDTQASGKPADAGAKGLETAAAAKAAGAETATAAKADGKSFGQTTAAKAKTR